MKTQIKHFVEPLRTAESQVFMYCREPKTLKISDRISI